MLSILDYQNLSQTEPMVGNCILHSNAKANYVSHDRFRALRNSGHPETNSGREFGSLLYPLLHLFSASRPLSPLFHPLLCAPFLSFLVFKSSERTNDKANGAARLADYQRTSRKSLTTMLSLPFTPMHGTFNCSRNSAFHILQSTRYFHNFTTDYCFKRILTSYLQHHRFAQFHLTSY